MFENPEIDCLLKPSHIIPPALALVAVLGWNLIQWRSISEQEEEGRILRERIETARSPGISGMDSAPGTRLLKSQGSTASEPIAWKNLAVRMAEMRKGGGMSDMRELMRVRKQLADMSKEEILAALAEIAALGLEPDARKMLEDVLVGPLIERDPELALATFGGRIANDPDGAGSQLSAALGAWAKKDLAAATAWFDRQLADGLFESKTLNGQSQARMEFEAALVGNLLPSDMAAAAQRIAALPEEQRRVALERISFSELSPAGQKAYAELVRGLVPQDLRAGSFTHVIAELIPDGGYAKVGGFLDDIAATPEERAVSAREAANAQLEEIAGERALTREDVDAMREWLTSQAPGTVDRVTGEALADAAQAGGEFGFTEAAKLALEYHRSSGNDDVLVAFLESFAARSNLEEALPLAEMILDAQRREELLKRLN
jgi:hypothetical protein